MTRFATSSDGARIAHGCMGRGRAVLLVHGFSADRIRAWHENGWAAALAEAGHEVIGFDVRGHGESDRPHHPAAYGTHLVEDMCAVLDAAGVSSAGVFGYSMGAHLAIAFALEHPSRAERLVLGGVGEAYFARDPVWFERIAAALEAEDGTEIRDLVARLHRKYGSENGNDRLALAAFMRAPPPFHPASEMARAALPVLVFCGERDGVSGRAEGLATAFPNGRALTIAGRDHHTAIADPAAMSAVLGFLGPATRP